MSRLEKTLIICATGLAVAVVVATWLLWRKLDRIEHAIYGLDLTIEQSRR